MRAPSFSGGGPPALGTITVLGLDDGNAKAAGAALPNMVLAEIRHLGGLTNQAKAQLRELERAERRLALPADTRLDPIPIPEGLKIDVSVPQTIAGVDIGWLLTWIKDTLAPTNVIDLTAT